MKNIFIILFVITIHATAFSQDFNKNLTAARSSYTSKSLSDARFSMEQMLRDLDIEIGKEILKLLPTKMDALNADVKGDNVTGTGTMTGLYVQRTYGTGTKTADIEIINNSQLITSLNTLLAMPFIGAASDANQKVVKVQGYKSILNKNTDSDANKVNYELQIPFNNTLVTFKLNDTTESDILRLAATIPLAKIAEMAQ